MQKEWDQGYGSSRSFKPVTGKKCSDCRVLWMHNNTSGLEVLLAKPLRCRDGKLTGPFGKQHRSWGWKVMLINWQFLAEFSGKPQGNWGSCNFPASSLPCFHFMEAAHMAFRGILLVIFAAILLFAVYVKEKITRLTCYFMHLEKQWLKSWKSPFFFFFLSLNFLGSVVPHYFSLHVQSQKGDWITPQNSQQKFPY